MLIAPHVPATLPQLASHVLTVLQAGKHVTASYTSQ